MATCMRVPAYLRCAWCLTATEHYRAPVMLGPRPSSAKRCPPTSTCNVVHVWITQAAVAFCGNASTRQRNYMMLFDVKARRSQCAIPKQSYTTTYNCYRHSVEVVRACLPSTVCVILRTLVTVRLCKCCFTDSLKVCACCVHVCTIL